MISASLIIESFNKILDEIVINPRVNEVKEEEKSDLIHNKKETTTVDLGTTFGKGRVKSAGFTSMVNQEETTTDVINRRNDIKKRDNLFDNTLFSKLTLYQKSLFIFKISLVFLSIIEGRKKKDDDFKQRVYSLWDSLLSGVDKYTDKQKAVFIQAMSEVFASFEDEAKNIDRGILLILTNNILLLRKQILEVFFDSEGYLSFALVNVEPEEELAEIENK